MSNEGLNQLVLDWRAEAEVLRRRGAFGQATALESVAGDLEWQLREWQEEALTLDEAAKESGYSYSSLQQKVAAGEILNRGEKGSPRVRRCDLPMRARRDQPRTDTGEPDLAREILTGRMDPR